MTPAVARDQVVRAYLTLRNAVHTRNPSRLVIAADAALTYIEAALNELPAMPPAPRDEGFCGCAQCRARRDAISATLGGTAIAAS